MAAVFPMRPRATAAAEATSPSLFCKWVVNKLTAWVSRRTPIELIVPTKRIPWSESVAVRNASFDASPGMASSAIRAHEDNCLLGNSFAKSATAALEPWMANRLQVIAFSAADAFWRRIASSSFSGSGDVLEPSSACSDEAAMTNHAARQKTTRRATKRVFGRMESMIGVQDIGAGAVCLC